MQTAAPTNEVYYDFTSMANVESLVSLGVSKGNPPRVIVYVLGMDTCCLCNKANRSLWGASSDLCRCKIDNRLFYIYILHNFDCASQCVCVILFQVL